MRKMPAVFNICAGVRPGDCSDFRRPRYREGERKVSEIIMERKAENTPRKAGIKGRAITKEGGEGPGPCGHSRR